jgi:hypothetical protein
LAPAARGFVYNCVPVKGVAADEFGNVTELGEAFLAKMAVFDSLEAEENEHLLWRRCADGLIEEDDWAAVLPEDRKIKFEGEARGNDLPVDINAEAIGWIAEVLSCETGCMPRLVALGHQQVSHFFCIVFVNEEIEVRELSKCEVLVGGDCEGWSFEGEDGEVMGGEEIENSAELFGEEEVCGGFAVGVAGEMGTEGDWD